MTESSVVINNLAVSYFDSGGTGIPVIFIHGFPFDKSMWLPQIESLADKYRMIAYDIRGFGHSTSGEETFSIDLFATDLSRFLDALKIEKAFACGLSMGGYILMNAAARFRQRFLGIVLADTQCIADSAENKEKRYATVSEIEKNGLTGFAENFVKNIFSRDTLENNKVLVERIKKIILNTSPKTITATLKALAERNESCTNLKSLHISTLILCGKEDTVTPLSQSELLNNALKGSVLHPIEKAGHMSNLEQPETFNEHLLNFLKNNS
jgi:3-oxoadipate enol-lactonase